VTAAHRVEHARAEDFLRTLPDASVDSVVTDPPYGLSNTTPAKVEACLRAWLSGDDYDHGAKGFMGREWDGWVPGPALWREVLRVLKPGGHALVFAGSRTVDLMGLALRLAGFEIRDTMQWLYGTGFPKSLNVAKAADPHAWAGWGTALKPAHEPVIVARKPFDGTVAANVVAHGTGALNIDGCRVWRATDDVSGWSNSGSAAGPNVAMSGANYARAPRPDNDAGRWPPNVVLIHPEGCEGDHNGAGCVNGCPVGEMGRQSGVSVATVSVGVHRRGRSGGIMGEVGALRDGRPEGHADSGTAARFFPSFHYCAKASRSEREAGLVAPDGARANRHPTVKPIDAMRWLCRLVTRPGGLVLDPFAGSGTTGCAAALEGFRFVGCEMDEAHADLARRRIAHWAPKGEPDAPDCDAPQLDLFGAAS
jgi:DNA modification methylase